MDAMDQGYGREGRGRQRLGDDPPDQRMDRWVSAGRQFVEGVAGSRPGGRPAPRSGDRRSARRPRFDDLGRWVEDRLDWLLEDGDEWREPWQEEERGNPAPAPRAPVRSRRQGLEAVSRRGRSATFDGPTDPSGAGPSEAAPSGDDDWPDDTSFRLPRWQRQEPGAPSAPAGEGEPPRRPAGSQSSRPLPRSSRRRV